MKNNNIYYTIIILTIILSGMVQADSSVNIVRADPQVFKFGGTGNILVGCQDKSVGSVCSTNTNATLTVWYPNGTVKLNSVLMTQAPDQSYFSYAVGGNFTNSLGDFQGTATVKDGSRSTQVDVPITITPTGDIRGASLMLILGLSALIFLLLGMIMQNQFIGFISGCIFLVLGVYALINGINNTMDIYTQTIGYVSVGFGLFITFASAYQDDGGLDF